MNPQSVKPARGEWERWTRAAAAAGMSRNGWIRKALNDQADLDVALANSTSPSERRLVEAGVQGPVSRLFERRV